MPSHSLFQLKISWFHGRLKSILFSAYYGLPQVAFQKCDWMQCHCRNWLCGEKSFTSIVIIFHPVGDCRIIPRNSRQFRSFFHVCLVYAAAAAFWRETKPASLHAYKRSSCLVMFWLNNADWHRLGLNPASQCAQRDYIIPLGACVHAYSLANTEFEAKLLWRTLHIYKRVPYNIFSSVLMCARGVSNICVHRNDRIGSSLDQFSI